jgi:hypothetical protein
MSARKQKEKEAKKRERLRQGQILAAAKPEPAAAVVSIPPSTEQNLPANIAPGLAVFLAELHHFAADYHELCIRSSHRLLLAGLREGAAAQSQTDAK